jgi:hypothetical protein
VWGPFATCLHRRIPTKTRSTVLAHCVHGCAVRTCARFTAFCCGHMACGSRFRAPASFGLRHNMFFVALQYVLTLMKSGSWQKGSTPTTTAAFLLAWYAASGARGTGAGVELHVSEQMLLAFGHKSPALRSLRATKSSGAAGRKCSIRHAASHSR